jgi:hypothetical protein
MVILHHSERDTSIGRIANIEHVCNTIVSWVHMHVWQLKPFGLSATYRDALVAVYHIYDMKIVTAPKHVVGPKRMQKKVLATIHKSWKSS